MQNPKTIADLIINLEFTKTEKFPTYSEFETYIKSKNSDIEKWNIKQGIYSFTVTIPTEIVNDYGWPKWETVDFDIPIYLGTNRSLINFLYRINEQIWTKIKKATIKYNTWTELDRFVLKSKNNFEIEFTLPF